MENLLVYALLLYEGLITEDQYSKYLDELFIKSPENDDLIYLECEKDITKAIGYIRTHNDYNTLDTECFGRFLMSELKTVYMNCTDIKDFAARIYGLWKILPRNIQDIEPFIILCYADDPLSWGDEKQTRNIYMHMLNYYND